jgi:phage recombination protein Bet
MGSVVPIHPTNAYSAGQLALIRNTVAKDCNGAEFDLFVTVARNAGLDPFRKQISAIVFSKDDPKKRRMSIITGIDGLRAIAARSGRYRPDEDEPQFEYDPAEKGPTNPLGLVKASVRVYIADTMKAGGWKPVTGVAYWTEFAPVKDEWAFDEQKNKRAPTGKQTLDGNWPKMPRVMLAKCAEAQALRKAFPEDMSALYESAELDRVHVEDLSPSEQVAEHAAHERLTRIGAVGIMFQMFPNGPLESIALGQIADRVAETVKGFSALDQIRWFESANRHPLQEFWARSPTDALELKKIIEGERKRLEEAATETVEP